MVPEAQPAGNDPLPHSATVEGPHSRGVVAGAAAAALRPLIEGLPQCDLRLVKRSTVRTVRQGTVGGLAVHLKLFRAGTLADRARDAVRGERGGREARNLRAAAALGLRAAEPLAFGVCRGPDGPQSFLITRSVPGARAFAFALPHAVQQATGILLRQAHDRGLLPRDLHPGNIVVDAHGAPWLLDLTSARHAGEADLERRAAALAFFCQELDGGPLDRAAGPLVHAYLAAGKPLPAAFTGALAQAARTIRHRALVAFGRRSGRPCRHTEMPPRRPGEPRWHLRVLDDADAMATLRAQSRAFAAAPPPPQRTGRRGAIWLLDELVVKQREQGAARRLFRAMYWLDFARVPQPEPVALRTFAGTGFVFARRLPGPALAAELQAGAVAPAALPGLARALGDAVGRLHAHGLRNRDLKLENLVRDPQRGRVCMVDLDGVRAKRPSDTRGQGADLGRLLAAFRAAGAPGGRSTVAAFARAYLRARQRLLQPAPARRLWRAAARRAREWASAHR